MSDPSRPVPGPTGTPAPASAPPTPVLPQRVRLIRWKLSVTLLILVVATVLVFPLVIEPCLLGMLRTRLAARGLELDAGSTLSLSILGGRLHGEHLLIRDAVSKQSVASATSLDADLAIGESLASWDIVIRTLSIDGMTGSLRRRSDGSPPVGKAQPAGSGTDWSKMDWRKWYQQAMDKYQQHCEKQKADQKAKQPAQPAPGQKKPTVAQSAKQPAEVDPSWPKATVYRPSAREGRSSMRVLIHTMSISGSKLDLPDQSPFDVLAFSLTGHDVTWVQNQGETMHLDAKIDTAGAGPATVAYQTTPDGDGSGSLALSVAKVPLAILNDAKIVGEDNSHYGASGTAAITMHDTWTGWNLVGSLTSNVTDLHLAPSPEAGSQSQQVAQVVNQLKGQPLTWPIQIGGTLTDPTITDNGISQVLSGSAKNALKNLATDRAQGEATKALEKEEVKNPEVKKAADSLNDLFKRK